MIEAIVGCAAAGALALFLERVVHRAPVQTEALDPRYAALAEKRRILERDRSEWAVTFKIEGVTATDLKRATRNMARIDAQLLALAEEQMALANEDIE